MRTVLHGEAGRPIVALDGDFGLAEAPTLRRLLMKLVLDGPDCVVCDLTALTSIDDHCIGIFTDMTVWGRWSDRLITLCGAHGQVADQFEAFGMGRYLATYDTLAQALAAAPAHTSRRHARLELQADPSAPYRAREFVREMCRRWQHQVLADDAELVTSELVTNVIRHAQGFAELRLELTESSLHVAVRDLGNSPPRLLQPGMDSEHGRGLRIVNALSRAWSFQEHPDGGKTVWAALARPADTNESAHVPQIQAVDEVTRRQPSESRLPPGLLSGV